MISLESNSKSREDFSRTDSCKNTITSYSYFLHAGSRIPTVASLAPIAPHIFSAFAKVPICLSLIQYSYPLRALYQPFSVGFSESDERYEPALLSQI